MNDRWPAWKVALVCGVLAFIALLVAGGVSGAMSSGDPEKAGEAMGQKYGILVLLAPVVGYIVQKSRLDRDEEKPR